MGFVINTSVSYNQRIETIQALESKIQIVEASYELHKQQTEQLNVLLEKVSNLEIKLEKLEKTGKSIK